MDATVVICTRNRADSLERTLGSLAGMEPPADLAWEVLIVDNGSTDHTSAVVGSFGEQLPISLTREENAGLSNARNHGVKRARGRYIVWTDDDVVVQSGWLAAYAAAFRRWPQSAVFGGKVRPVLEEPVPAWFSAARGELADLLAARDFGEISLPLGDGCLPFGANYAVRTAEQLRFPYDPELGVAPGRNRMGEETKVIRAILGQGGTGFYVPEAAVEHMIPRSRQSFSYIAAYYRAHGETAALAERLPPGRTVGGLPPWLVRKIATAWALYTFARIGSAPPIYVRHLKTLAYFLGYAAFLKNGAETRRSGP